MEQNLDDMKKTIHSMTNKLQVVLSHLEANQCDKALRACRDAIKDLRSIAVQLIAIKKLEAKARHASLEEAVQVISDTIIKAKLDK